MWLLVQVLLAIGGSYILFSLYMLMRNSLTYRRHIQGADCIGEYMRRDEIMSLPFKEFDTILRDLFDNALIDYDTYMWDMFRFGSVVKEEYKYIEKGLRNEDN